VKPERRIGTMQCRDKFQLKQLNDAAWIDLL
jgi:hypothetical protein